MGSPQPCRPQHAACVSPPLPERPLQVKVVGLFSCPNFQIAKSAAEVTAEKPPSRAALRAPGSRPRALRSQRLLEAGRVEVSRAEEGAGLSGLGGLGLEDQEESNLKNNHPSKFEDPILVPLQEFAWHQYLQEKKRELKNETWEYSSSVISFVNGQLLGDALDLQKWAHEVWDIIDIKPSALYDALAEDFSTKFLRDTKASYTNF
ncbi:putative inactive peptidyl-prolyl cis-trans isomerase-like 6 [Plecturocebus cupreus]